ncbi:MAG: cytochrome c [Nitrospirae bacterium]|nr:MAG: cytochrome c [Nitrospirota bacterium]
MDTLASGEQWDMGFIIRLQDAMMSPVRAWWIVLVCYLVTLMPCFSLARATEESDVRKGAAIYARYCEECHGPEGRGNGPKAPLLSPRPGSFVSAATSVKSDAELLQIIENGVPRTAMKGWKDILSKEDRLNVLAYIRSLVHFHPPSLTPPPPDREFTGPRHP